jgi:DNA polymerase-3 subunit gamma/tau
MATQALYRKWRPRTFEEVVGQRHVTHTLQNALATDRVAHAYLFTGPRGTGKTTTARLLAKAVNCVGEGDSKPCGACNICRAVEEGRLLDMIEIDAASNRGIDEMRDLREKVGFRPGEAHIKFYIIDEVHMLTDPAFNALLKTLEEPPAHVIFVLATTEPHKIPATIISRCQRFDFRRIPLAEISEWLAHIAQAEGLRVEPLALEYIARQGGGSMRDAISLLDQLTAYGSDTITLAQVQTVLGAVASGAVIELADSFIDADLVRGFDIINQVIADGAEPRQFTREFVEYLRGLLLLKMGDGASLLQASVPEETLARMQEQVARLSPRTLLRATRLFNAAALEMKAGFLPQLPLELAFAETVMDDSPEKELPASQPRAAEQKEPMNATPASRSTPPISTPTSSPKVKETAPVLQTSATQPTEATNTSVSRATLSFETVEANWQDTLIELRQVSKMDEALMRSVRLIGVEGNRVVVEASSDLLKGRIDQPASKSRIEQSIGHVVGCSVSLRCVLKGEYQTGVRQSSSPSDTNSTNEGSRTESKPASDNTQDDSGEADTESDPMVEEALNLGAQIRNVD